MKLKIVPNRPKVLIVGGSFSGLAAARHLKKSADVILIEPRDYFEYTPGILHVCVGSKNSIDHIMSPISTVAQDCDIRRGIFVGCRPELKEAVFYPISDEGKSTESMPITIKFDAIIIATGSPYSVPIKPSIDSFSLQNRVSELQQFDETITNSKNVVITGGGLVGVELAAEVAWRKNAAKNKTIVLLSRSNLLGALPNRAGELAHEWLRGHNVTVIIGDQVLSQSGDQIVTERGLKIKADLFIDCTGVTKNSNVLKKISDKDSVKSEIEDSTTPYSLVWPYSAGGCIEVDDHLQSTRYPGLGIFAAGDAVEHTHGVGFAFSSEKTGAFGAPARLPGVRNAHLAESQAELCAENVLRFLESKKGPPKKTFFSRHRADTMLRYPRDVFGADLNPLLACVSLGPREGIIIFNNVVVGGMLLGLLGGLVKFLIERTKISEIRNETFGRAFWAFGHVVCNFIHRWMLRLRFLFLRRNSPKPSTEMKFA